MSEQKEEKKISIKEFKMWLEGVEEMQTDDWTPDARQWKRIREKINCVLDDEPPIAMGHTVPSFAPTVLDHAANKEPVLPMGPVPSSSMAPPTSASPPRAPQPPMSGPFAGSGTIKTPDLDTSGGRYDSSFV